ncbi:hypothetical protein GW15_0202590 [Xanthomonas axonopodis pv. vasculorum]|uniref:Uncharacterized protein n=1 Tax=Xanthomonas axonopodis pv. vasculorum TaxID=325777 RepID=A0A098Q209_9XANT|nr:hypothetical protein GW15_0202590 [Xanthomonas axonopodis pv. vasculorum]PPV08450.1 hypothetical protein XavaCFBP5823_17760 [Xanthomonas axonopodis pv. vasculorum]
MRIARIEAWQVSEVPNRRGRAQPDAASPHAGIGQSGLLQSAGRARDAQTAGQEEPTRVATRLVARAPVDMVRNIFDLTPKGVPPALPGWQ